MRSSIAASVGFAVAGGSRAEQKSTDRPNILWLTSEDNGISWISCYGSPNCKTPAIDQLAREGFRYTHCIDNAAVCAPTRSTWLTGMMAISNGTQPMRSRNNIPQDKIMPYPKLLRNAGYFCRNNGKTDYNMGNLRSRSCWDKTSWEKTEVLTGWPTDKKNHPFFVVINYVQSHEGRSHGSVEDTINDPLKMKLAAYHPDLPVIRKNYAKYADAVQRMDGDIGNTIKALKKDGLYDDTIIIYCSDHGGVMAGSKRFVNSRGTHCPLVIRIPEKWRHLYPAKEPGLSVDRLVSFVDMPKTWLSLAGAKIPETYQGTIFLGPDMEDEPRYHLSFRERSDECYDNVRMVRDKQYAYVKNYMPYVPSGQHLDTLWKAEATRAWAAHHQAGRTNDVTGRFFRPRLSEEFYDTVKDFDNVVNLIDSPEHQKRIGEMRKAMRKMQLGYHDSGLLPELMRSQRAAEYGLTIYEMVRDPKKYPLADYLDLADLALDRNVVNLEKFSALLSDSDPGMRYWATIGLFLLDEKAKPTIAELERVASDKYIETSAMASWALVRLGEKGKVPGFPKSIKHKELRDCVINWMAVDKLSAQL